MVSLTPLLALCLFLNLFHIPVLAKPLEASHADHPTACRQLLQRKEWRTLSDVEKKCYIDAVKCLQSRPTHNGSRPASWTRFDEFQATHIELALGIHLVGHFFPWHRQFVTVYERALRKECGYKGAQPYWDWSIDVEPPNTLGNSPIWDPITGFGGDGVPGTYIVPPDPDPKNSSRINPQAYRGCVKDGPFSNYTIKLGPGLLVTEHCLTRGINNTNIIYVNSSVVAQTLAFPTFELFRIEAAGFKLHIGGHWAVDGEMQNFFSSPADPLFYLHHANLDRIWWRWQEAYPHRLDEISGNNSTSPPFGNVTLDYPLQMGALGPTLLIRDVMDIRKEASCYIYV